MTRMNRTTTVTLPDGNVATRTSRTRVYTWAVMQTEDAHAHGAYLQTAAARVAEVAATVRKMIETADFSGLAVKLTSQDGQGRKFYNSYLPGDEQRADTDVHYWLPDYRDSASWNTYIDGTLERMDHTATLFEQQAAQLLAGPKWRYGIVQWCSRQDLATKASNNKQFNFRPWLSCQPVPCQEA